MSGTGFKRRRAKTAESSAAAAGGAGAGPAQPQAAAFRTKAAAKAPSSSSSTSSIATKPDSKALLAAERERILKLLPLAKTEVLERIIAALLETDSNVAFMTAILPAKKRRAALAHCVLCHAEFDPALNGRGQMCSIEHKDDGGYVGRGECYCRDYDCAAGSCDRCGDIYCESGGWKGEGECYSGPHIADVGEAPFDEDELDELAQSCDRCCASESGDEEE